MRKRMIIAIFEWISISTVALCSAVAQDYFFGRNYFLMYEHFFLFFLLSARDWPKIGEKKTGKSSEFNEKRSKFVLLRGSCNSFLFPFLYLSLSSTQFFFSCHNYVQLQFHKSMIYSYGLHFYSIPFALHTKTSTFWRFAARIFCFFSDINVNLFSCNEFS